MPPGKQGVPVPQEFAANSSELPGPLLRIEFTAGATPKNFAKPPPRIRLTPIPNLTLWEPKVKFPSYFPCLLLWKVAWGARIFVPEQKDSPPPRQVKSRKGAMINAMPGAGLVTPWVASAMALRNFM